MNNENNDKNLLIFYLSANDRYFVFTKFIDELIKCKDINRVKLLIVNSDEDSSFYDNYLKNIEISYEFAHVECPQSNYIPKVKFAIEYAKQNNYEYIMKYDNDMIIPSYTLNFILDNLDKLDNDDVATISPTITTGIPSVEYFIDDFIDDATSLSIREEFKKCEFHIQPNVMDYRPMNICTLGNSGNWDYEDYYEKLNIYTDSYPDYGNGRTNYGFCKFYKGIHPIRHGFGNQLINDYIIKHKKRFFEDKKCLLYRDTHPYLCDMCFIIKTKNYDRLINIDDLLIDGCDEVPVNRFAWNNNKKHYIIRGGFAIHITYNWRWDLNKEFGGSNIDRPTLTLEEYEKQFIELLYDTN